MAGKSTRPPRGLDLDGRRLWDTVLRQFEVDEHERMLLFEACRTVDIVNWLSAAAEQAGAGGRAATAC